MSLARQVFRRKNFLQLNGENTKGMRVDYRFIAINLRKEKKSQYLMTKQKTMIFGDHD
jgi:hypothetical protein